MPADATNHADSSSLFELGVQGHIEDIAIAKQEQKKGLGLALLNGLDEIAVKAGCYKVCIDPIQSDTGWTDQSKDYSRLLAQKCWLLQKVRL